MLEYRVFWKDAILDEDVVLDDVETMEEAIQLIKTWVELCEGEEGKDRANYRIEKVEE